MITGCCNQSSKPKHDIADIFRQSGQLFLKNYNASHEQIKVLNRIISCRTATLGGHIDACPNCGHRQNTYNSCRNRHCPKWGEGRLARLYELLPVYVGDIVPNRMEEAWNTS